jgi:hypothetical protein
MKLYTSVIEVYILQYQGSHLLERNPEWPQCFIVTVIFSQGPNYIGTNNSKVGTCFPCMFHSGVEHDISYDMNGSICLFGQILINTNLTKRTC